MANLLGIKNYVKSDGTEKLTAAYGNDIGVFDGVSTFDGQGRNLSPQKMEFDVFTDYLIGVNATNNNQVYNGTAWFDGGARTRMPRARYVKAVGSYCYLADLTYASTTFRSRVWKSNLPFNNDITWGFETGTNLVTTAGSKTVKSANSGFFTYKLKTGDAFFITTGNNAGEYIIDTVDGDQQLTLLEEMKFSSTGDTFWAGSNFFDARTSDGDYLRGLGENDNKLLVFKRESLYKYDEKELRRVKGVPGTTSHRSVVNINENTYYFHPRGIFRYDGTTSFIISRAIEDWIKGIASDNYSEIVGWSDEEILYYFVGDITNSNRNISITNGLLIYDTAAQAWHIGRLNNVVKVASEAVTNHQNRVFLGTTNDEVLEWADGNDDMGTPIEWKAASIFHFPAKVVNVVEFTKVEVHTFEGRGISVYYKLYQANTIDNQWKPLGDINNDVTTLIFPRGTFGRGIALMFQEISGRLSPVFMRADVYYKDREERNLPTEIGE